MLTPTNLGEKIYAGNGGSHDDSHACLYVRRLVSGLPRAKREARRFLVLQFWLDDSGKEKLPIFVLAGYAASVEEWSAFADDWQALLDKEPKLDYIKAYEAFGFRKQFKGWSEFHRDRRLMEFVPLIRKYSNRGLAFTIGHNHFSDKNDPVWGFKQPYMFAYITALSGLLKFAQDNPAKEKIEVIFDNGVVHRRQAKAAYKELFRRLPKDATDLLDRDEPRFEDDKKFNPLQAADLLAHCVRARSDPNPLYDRVRVSPIYNALMRGVAILPIDEAVSLYKERTKKMLSGGL
jgi:uncharacterized protein DUF3800